MYFFVNKDSIVRHIWGKSDVILFIFAGASAEFALSKAVDWLYFTGRLPADPLGRLFSTVKYAQAIVFSENEDAIRAINTMSVIHAQVETKRAAKIPDWAYRDVLFMLIDYSIRSFEALERKLSIEEKEEVFHIFIHVGNHMGLIGLPETFEQWQTMRQEHLNQNMQYSAYTDDLFSQYRKHLGMIRYKILLNIQSLVIPRKAKELLKFNQSKFPSLLIDLYQLSKMVRIDWLLKTLILPSKYKNEIKALDKKTPA